MPLCFQLLMPFRSKCGKSFLRFSLRARRGTKMAQASISLCFSTRAASLPISGSVGRFSLLDTRLKACKHWVASLFCFCVCVGKLRQFAAVFGWLRQFFGTKMAQNVRPMFPEAGTHPIGCPTVSTSSAHSGSCR